MYEEKTFYIRVGNQVEQVTEEVTENVTKWIRDNDIWKTK